MLLFLGGLDEVATEQRQLVVDMVNALLRRRGWHRYLVTCRPYAYVGQPWKLYRFHKVTLAPFSPAQSALFVDNWYRQLAERVVSPPPKRSSAPPICNARSSDLT